MKIKKRILFIMMFMMMFILVGCGDEGTPSQPTVSITPSVSEIKISDVTVETYDFTKLFTIKEGSKEIKVLEEYIDSTAVLNQTGTYTITCTYKDKNATISVVVFEATYSLDLLKEEVTVELANLATYDFLSLFVAKTNDETIEITDKMITTNITNSVGTYIYQVTLGNISKSLKVNVINTNKSYVVVAYSVFELPINEVETFDYKTLFNVYNNGVSVEVTDKMIDKKALNDVKVGSTYEVKFSHTLNGENLNASINVKIKDIEQVVVKTKNIITYPNSDYIDLTTLFEITKGSQTIKVDQSMISGCIDYTKDGENQIKLSYLNQEYVSIVTVKKGVVINYKTSDTITIKKGTDQEAYSFINDFVVLINGIKFVNLSDAYIVSNNVDFSKPGRYTVEISIPYNQAKLGLSSVKFEYTNATITYIVVDNIYSINLLKDEVILPINTTKYNVLNNVKIIINGKNQALTTNKSYVDAITCYAEIKSGEIDFNSVAQQQVVIDVFANGVDNAPVEVKYNLIIESNIVVDAHDTTMFSDEALYITDLFTIKNGTTNIEVLPEYITSNLNTKVPGIYEVSINYLGIKKVAKVIVFDDAMKGTYKTKQTTIATSSTEDEEGYQTEGTKARVLQDSIITSTSNIIINGKEATIVKGISPTSMIVKRASYEYLLNYENGILTLDPDNSIKLGYNEDKRPLLYFNESMWKIDQTLIINNSSTHVIATSITTYSIDTFHITSKVSDESMWYGVLVRLVEKTSADTIYTVRFAKAIYDKDFEIIKNKTSKVEFDNKIYDFVITSSSTAKTKIETHEKVFANKTFTGTIDNEPGLIITDSFEAFVIKKNNELIYSQSAHDINTQKYGGINYATNEIMLYTCAPKIPPQSFKFVLDTTNNTFEFIKKDEYYGKYEFDNMYVFLDGFGMGLINFNTSSYYHTVFSYTVNSGILTINYQDALPTFEYGTNAEFVLDDFGNKLTVRKFIGKDIIGKEFINKNITDGALVEISSFKVGQDADSVAKAVMFNNINIITKDGKLTNEQKASLIDVSKIKFSTPGFYQFTITIKTNSKNVTSYYAIEVLEAKFKDSPLVNAYGKGVMLKDNELIIDKYGVVTLNTLTGVYTGNIKVKSDNSFTSTLRTNTGKEVKLNATYISNGIILVRCAGSIAFSDYYTVASKTVSGTDGAVLRTFTKNDKTTYILSTSPVATGKVVDVTFVNKETSLCVGAVLKIVDDGKIIYVKINGLDDEKTGLQLSDPYRGTYKNTQLSDLTVDGFGVATNNDISGTYTISSSIITVVSNNTIKAYKLDVNEKTYEEIEVNLNNSSFVGKSFVANHTYVCNYASYQATTTFEFLNDGIVVAKSTSSTHDSGDYACEEDIYSPTYASKTGISGNYNVSGRMLTITINEKTFVFTIDDVIKLNTLTCTSTTLTSSEHGYFKVSTVFTIN